jgi:hypothetical protein
MLPASVQPSGIGHGSAVEERDWLPTGPVIVGLTAGASTPNNKIGGWSRPSRACRRWRSRRRRHR